MNRKITTLVRNQIYVPTSIFIEVIHSYPLEKNEDTNVNNVPNVDEVPMLPQKLLRKSQREKKVYNI
jgi:hypothetical protein